MKHEIIWYDLLSKNYKNADYRLTESLSALYLVQYHCSYCGAVVCGTCGGNQAPLPFYATTKPHRVCRTCFKLMRRRIEDLEEQLST